MITPSTTTDLFAITPVKNGSSAPADALVVGPMREVMEYLPQSVARQDAVEELEKARFTADQIASVQQKTRGVQASMLCDSVNHLASRLDALLQRKADEAKRRADEEAEEEAARIQCELDALPDPDDPGEHENTGDLHALQSPEQDQAEFEEPEDPTGVSIPQPTALEFD